MGKTSEEQPYFRFNPNAYEHEGTFERSAEACESCFRPCAWKYVGNIHALREPVACARCIADGAMANLFGGDRFSLHDAESSGVDQGLERELLQRTPGFSCFNPFEWPVLDARPMAFVGYGEDERLIAIPSVRTAMEDAFAELGWDFGPSPYALIFKAIDSDQYQVVVDLD